jgi:hypothetical protein
MMGLVPGTLRSQVASDRAAVAVAVAVAEPRTDFRTSENRENTEDRDSVELLDDRADDRDLDFLTRTGEELDATLA